MLIVGKFHDYYDMIAKTGVDRTVVYNRERKVIKHKLEKKNSNRWYSSDWHSDEFTVRREGRDIKLYVYAVVVGFCGKLYPAYIVEENRGIGGKIHGLYDLTQVKKFLKMAELPKPSSRSYTRYGSSYNINDPGGPGLMFDRSDVSELSKMFTKHNVPAFVFGSARLLDPESRSDNTVLVLNPCLKNLAFMRAVTPTEAFQSVYMFISGVLGTPVKPTVTVSDKVKAAKKGHGDKYSFRRLPTPKGDKKRPKSR